MKKLIFLIVICNIDLICYSQLPNTLLRPDNKLEIYEDEVRLKSVNNNKVFDGIEYTFNGKLKNAAYDTLTNNFIFVLRYRGADGYNGIHAYQPDEDSIYWAYKTFAKEIFFDKNNVILQYYEPFSGSLTYFGIDRKSGTPRFVRENEHLVIIPERDIYLVFPFYGFSKEYTIHDRGTNVELARYDLSTEYDYTGYFSHDSIFVLYLDGIQVLNNDYELLWNRQIDTKKLNIGSVLLSAGLSLGLSIFSQGYAPLLLFPNYSSGLRSNALIFSDKLIISDAANIYAFNWKTGESIWEQEQPFKGGYSTILRTSDSTILFFNSGLSSRKGKVKDHSQPYCATMNVKDGRFITIDKFSQSTNIHGKQVRGDSIFILFNNGIACFEDGVFIDTIIDHSNYYGPLYSFIDMPDNTICFWNDVASEWQKLDMLVNTGNELFVLGDQGIIVFNQDLEVTKLIPFNNVGALVYEKENNMYIQTFTQKKNRIKLDQLIRFDNFTSQQTKLDFNGAYVINDDRLIIKKKRSIAVFDLD